MIRAEDISKKQFEDALGRYEEIVKGLEKRSKGTGMKNGRALEELDDFRYGEALKRCKSNKRLHLEDLKILMEWKLTHGKFRPNLANLAASNTESSVIKTTQVAFELYQKDTSNISKPIKALTDLRGVGPATASLLLAIYDSGSVVFFGDEVFRWLCCGGKEESIKYTMKEYETLVGKSRELIERIDVRAVDVEKVGYVLMREGSGAAVNTTEGENQESFVSSDAKEKDAVIPPPAQKKEVKRKAGKEPYEGGVPELRRSKRDKV